MEMFKIKKGEKNFLLSKFTKIGIFYFAFMEKFNSNTRAWLVAECGTTITAYLTENDVLMKGQNRDSVIVLVELHLKRVIGLVLLALPSKDFQGCGTLSKLLLPWGAKHSCLPSTGSGVAPIASRQPHVYPHLKHL